MNVKQLDIVLADDDADDCLFFKDALEGMPISMQLTVLHDGEQLMRFLYSKTNKLPHILFLDLNMPRKNGFECLSEIKNNKTLHNIPVVIFSTSLEKEVVDRLYENGAQYFIRKPPEFSQFKKMVLFVLTLLIQENISQRAKEDFVLTVEKSLII